MPTHFDSGESEEVVISKAIDGTLGILRVCLNSKTVKRVVYTSSASAVDFNNKTAQVMDESFWSDVDYIKALNSFASSYCSSAFGCWTLHLSLYTQLRLLGSRCDLW